MSRIRCRWTPRHRCRLTTLRRWTRCCRRPIRWARCTTCAVPDRCAGQARRARHGSAACHSWTTGPRRRARQPLSARTSCSRHQGWPSLAGRSRSSTSAAGRSVQRGGGVCCHGAGGPSPPPGGCRGVLFLPSPAAAVLSASSQHALDNSSHGDDQLLHYPPPDQSTLTQRSRRGLRGEACATCERFATQDRRTCLGSRQG